MFRRQTGHTRTLRQSTAQKQTHTLTAETPCHWLSRGVQRNVTSRSYSVRSPRHLWPTSFSGARSKGGPVEWHSWMALVARSWMALPVTFLPGLCPGGARRWSRGGGGARPGGGGRIQKLFGAYHARAIIMIIVLKLVSQSRYSLAC